MKNTKSILLLVLCAVSTTVTYAQKTFSITTGSKNYSAKIQVPNCDDNTCSGKGTITLYQNNNSKVFQTLISPEIFIYLDQKSGKPTANLTNKTGEENPLVFDDFNFDGSEDIAVRNGNKSGYGGPSYDVYVFNRTKKQFVLSKELTRLASNNLGMFETNSKTKRLSTFTKSGCCWHQYFEYEVVPNKGLVLVSKRTEDATKNQDNVIVTKELLVNGKWKKTTKTYKTDDYFKQ